MAIGTLLSPLGLILASFATQLWHVYLSQGILFGLGAAFVFSPSVTLPSQWFTSRRALATGIAVSGSGIGGVCMSPMSQNLIQNIGYRNALRVQGSFGFALLCIATALATCRYRPPSSANGKDKWYHIFDRRLINRKFVLLLCFGFFVPFGYVAPFFLAPQFAQYIGLDTATGAAMISVMSAANAICRISLGYLADRIGRFNTMFAFTFLSGLFTMVIWQFSSNYATFAVYCVLFGLTAGGFVSLLPVTTADIVGVENIQKGLGMAYMTTVIGNLIGTPIIGLLFNTFSWTAAIQFAGSMTLASSLFILALRMMMAKGKVFVSV
ncbi:major facilitator superfamily domain-containing protein [Mycotypha africana]|uniref:major facilitator superfamily domain-containing protein n=1 Tax=Mycotypha africana TaxID=64632 RepID=UPI002301E2F5|nr:major facilitator superfamily domain-containing protein [Mycotypha africana]KAI8991431.1 major facilitator superfamily domain-containing protein [Mycotypha africana]